jgi:hypothetical protein
MSKDMKDERIRQYQRLLKLIGNKEYSVTEYKNTIVDYFKCKDTTAEKHLKNMHRLSLVSIGDKVKNLYCK